MKIFILQLVTKIRLFFPREQGLIFSPKFSWVADSFRLNIRRYLFCIQFYLINTVQFIKKKKFLILGFTNLNFLTNMLRKMKSF